MYHLINNSKMPKWIKVVFNVVLTLALFYLIGLLIYWIFEGLRLVLHFMTTKGHWWFMLLMLFICGVCILLAGQFYFNLDPFGKIADFFVNTFYNAKETIIGWF